MGLYLKIIQDKAHYNNILILGYGDLAKQLANILKSNYDITICNRNNKDLDEIKSNLSSFGFKCFIRKV